MIDREFIGTKFDPVTVEVEKGQLAFFAKAIGETNPVYFDETAAREAGHPAIPAPPTFAFSLNNLPRTDPFEHLPRLGIDIEKILHGEQRFEYFCPIYAGDVLNMQEVVVDIYDKKSGTLEFLVTENPAVNQRGETAVVMKNVLVVRN